MPAIVDIMKIIELKRALEDKFEMKLHIHDTFGGQYFSVENATPSGKDYIENYFIGKYQVIFQNDNEFYLEDIRLC